LKGVVLNRVHHEFNTGPGAEQLPEIGLEDIEEVASVVAQALGGREDEARDLAANFADYQVLARGESLRIEQFRAGLPRRVPLVAVPNFSRDVHDLRALAAMHAHLFPGPSGGA